MTTSQSNHIAKVITRIALVVLIFLAATSCKTQCVPERIEVEKIVEYHHRDTTIVTEADSASAMALLECDSNFNVVLADLSLLNGERLSLQAQLKRLGNGQSLLNVDCREDSLQQRIEWLEKELSEKQTETIVKKVRELNWWDKFCHWATISLFVALLLFVAYKLLKLYLRR